MIIVCYRYVGKRIAVEITRCHHQIIRIIQLKLIAIIPNPFRLNQRSLGKTFETAVSVVVIDSYETSVIIRAFVKHVGIRGNVEAAVLIKILQKERQQCLVITHVHVGFEAANVLGTFKVSCPVVEVNREYHIVSRHIESADDHIGKSVVVDITDLDTARFGKQFVHLAAHLCLHRHPACHHQQRNQGVKSCCFHCSIGFISHICRICPFPPFKGARGIEGVAAGRGSPPS